jgi:hypothetical protein
VVPVTGDMPLSSDSRKALGDTVEEAESFRHDTIRCAHLLLGILRTENSTAAAILHENEITYPRILGIAKELPPE